jgi:glycerol-3-phosphate cytidylyltransferase-like family protein
MKTSPRDAVDFVVFMVVSNQEQKPVLIVEIKDDRWVNGPDKRQRADAQMRQWYDQMLVDCAIPRLYGLSLLGTSLRVYCGHRDTGEVTWHLTMSVALIWIVFCRPTSWRDSGI